VPAQEHGGLRFKKHHAAAHKPDAGSLTWRHPASKTARTVGRTLCARCLLLSL